jgi:GDP-mannose 6-dehydrogenase
MNISVFGLGYVGCISLGCLARNGYKVTGVDSQQFKVDLINNGKPTIIEKDIDSIILEQHEKGRISATTDFIKAILETDISVICVGTPQTSSGQLDLSYIFKTAEQTGQALKLKNQFHIVVIRSTVMPGTNIKFGQIIETVSGKKRNIDFAVVSNPEFLREGNAVEDYYNPSLTVLGGDHAEALQKVASLYDLVNAPLEIVDIPVAEMIKYINNSFHALKIVFANEVGNICKALNIDSHQVMDLFCKDTKLNISKAYFKPGFAYGGSCLPKDLLGLKTIAHDHYIETPVLASIERSNSFQKEIGFKMITDTKKRKIGFIGLGFKEGTDDLRYSPALELAERLVGKGYELIIYDKNVHLSNIFGSNRSFIEAHLPHLKDLIVDDPAELIDKSEVIVIFHNIPEVTALYPKLKGHILVDFARIPADHAGFSYTGISW